MVGCSGQSGTGHLLVLEMQTPVTFGQPVFVRTLVVSAAVLWRIGTEEKDINVS